MQESGGNEVTLKDKISNIIVNNGCICQRCNLPYKVDFILSDKKWKEIHGGYNLLCGKCIAELLEKEDKFDFFFLTKKWG